MDLAEQRVECPYCGEAITILLDIQEVDSDYVEDCQVCCRPMVVSVFAEGNGLISASTRREDD